MGLEKIRKWKEKNREGINALKFWATAGLVLFGGYEGIYFCYNCIKAPERNRVDYAITKLIDKYDLDHDGRISGQETKNLLSAMGYPYLLPDENFSMTFASKEVREFSWGGERNYWVVDMRLKNSHGSKLRAYRYQPLLKDVEGVLQ